MELKLPEDEYEKLLALAAEYSAAAKALAARPTSVFYWNRKQDTERILITAAAPWTLALIAELQLCRTTLSRKPASLRGTRRAGNPPLLQPKDKS